MKERYLEGRTALVTGSVQGIGLAIASLLAEKQPSLRTSDPAEIGEVAAWLCHPRMHKLTGATIPVDGGWTAQ